MERWGFGWKEVNKKYPKLIYASASGFGQTGPLKELPAYDMVVQGMGGLMSVTGQPNSEPTRVGTSIGGMLPFSRSHETEADQIGLYLMAIAGYNPDEASLLWERMKSNSGDKSPREFLSTHPSNDSRIIKLKALAKDAKSEALKFGVTSFR